MALVGWAAGAADRAAGRRLADLARAPAGRPSSPPTCRCWSTNGWSTGRSGWACRSAPATRPTNTHARWWPLPEAQAVCREVTDDYVRYRFSGANPPAKQPQDDDAGAAGKPGRQLESVFWKAWRRSWRAAAAQAGRSAHAWCRRRMKGAMGHSSQRTLASSPDARNCHERRMRQERHQQTICVSSGRLDLVILTISTGSMAVAPNSLRNFSTGSSRSAMIVGQPVVPIVHGDDDALAPTCRPAPPRAPGRACRRRRLAPSTHRPRRCSTPRSQTAPALHRCRPYVQSSDRQTRKRRRRCVPAWSPFRLPVIGGQAGDEDIFDFVLARPAQHLWLARHPLGGVVAGAVMADGHNVGAHFGSDSPTDLS